jgi:ProP effector
LNCYNPRIFHVVDCIMGFEQLAALKDQLAKQAEEKRAARKAKAGRPAPAAKRNAPASGQKAVTQNVPSPNAPSQNARSQNTRSHNAPSPKAAAQKSKPVDPVVLSIGKLQKRFPKAFPKNPAPKVPLKVGIFKDLLEHSEELGLNEAALRDAIKVWCWGSRYWACVVDNAMRVDLNGEDAGQVLPAEASRARGLQAKRQKSKNAAQNSNAASQDGTPPQNGTASQDGTPPQNGAASQNDNVSQETTVQQSEPAQPSGSAQQDSAA